MPKIAAPSEGELLNLMGESVFVQWKELKDQILSQYDVEEEWHAGGKAGQYELKFRRGGKTLVSLFPHEDNIGCMIIYGRAERDKFEAVRGDYPVDILEVYDKARTYHDGKWMMFVWPAVDLQSCLLSLLAHKRKPNRRQGADQPSG